MPILNVFHILQNNCHGYLTRAMWAKSRTVNRKSDLALRTRSIGNVAVIEHWPSDVSLRRWNYLSLLHQWRRRNSNSIFKCGWYFWSDHDLSNNLKIIISKCPTLMRIGVKNSQFFLVMGSYFFHIKLVVHISIRDKEKNFNTVLFTYAGHTGSGRDKHELKYESMGDRSIVARILIFLLATGCWRMRIAYACARSSEYIRSISFQLLLSNRVTYTKILKCAADRLLSRVLFSHRNAQYCCFVHVFQFIFLLVIPFEHHICYNSDQCLLFHSQ